MDWGALRPGEPLPMAEHCRYQFLAHAEGITYSGRLKYLMQCASVVITHENEWLQHFHHLINFEGADQNMIKVRGPSFEGIVETVEFLQEDADFAKKVVKNSLATFRDRYLSPAATECYWRELLFQWGKLIPWNVNVADSVTYEDFILMDKVQWNPF
jgi:hypothetical protein